MSWFFSEIWAAWRSPTRLTIWLLSSAFVAAIGPIATWSIESPLIRFAYWAFVSMMGITIALATRLFLRRLAPGLGPILVAMLVGLSVGLVLTPLTLRFTGVLLSDDYSGWHPDWTLFFLIAAVPIFVDLIRFFAHHSSEKSQQGAVKEPRLWKRLPEHCHSEILHLAGRGHHVEVRTDNGVCRIRLRLSDAIAELDEVDGLCVHRSHWVAVSAVERSEWDKGRPVLVLRDATRVPVSQKYEPGVLARGLITRSKETAQAGA